MEKLRCWFVQFSIENVLIEKKSSIRKENKRQVGKSAYKRH